MDGWIHPLPALRFVCAPPYLPAVPGLAHFLEHAVHLGSTKYPDEKEYKAYLAQHGGTSNASTSACRRALQVSMLSRMHACTRTHTVPVA